MKFIKIHREGKKIILTIIGILVAINVLAFLTVQDWQIIRGLLIFSSVAFLLFSLYFFRNPFREITIEENNILSPADGKVVVIEEVEEPEYFKDKRIQISIFMSPANVHVNRNPISGLVQYVQYHPGKYLVAWHPKSSTLNERNSVVIKNDFFEVMMTQIAGKVARRIVNYVNPGDEVEQGDEFGFIKFGSRVDLFLPTDTEISVKLNEKVRGGITVIGKLQ